jgi:hypothetical protein
MSLGEQAQPRVTTMPVKIKMWFKFNVLKIIQPR